MTIPPSWVSNADWQRQVASNVNPILTRVTRDIANLSYTGNAGKKLKVKDDESGVELANDVVWTEVTLASDYARTGTGYQAVTDGTTPLQFTPPASKAWEAEVVLILQGSATTNPPKIRVDVSAQGTGAFGGGRIQLPETSTSSSVGHGTWTTAATTFQVTPASFPTANSPHIGTCVLRGKSGTAPAPIAIHCGATTSGATVTVKAGSQIRHKAT